MSRIADSIRSSETAVKNGAPELVIRSLQVFQGPGQWSSLPVVHALVDVRGGSLAGVGSSESVWTEAVDLIQRCAATSPLDSVSFDELTASPVSLEAISADITYRVLRLAGWNTTGCFVVAEGDQVFHLVCDYENPDMTTRAVAFSLQVINQILSQDVQEPQLAEVFRSLGFDRSELGSIDRYIYQARERGIPVRRFGNADNSIELGTGKYIKRTIGQITAECAVTGVQTSGDKSLTNQLLRDRGLPVPRSIGARNAKQAVAAAKRIGFPVVLKPLSGNHGRGVCINLTTPEEVEAFFPVASQVARSGSVVIETYLVGRDYRILVIDDEVVAVTERVPAAVTGDGVHDIRDLIEMTNAEPNRGKPFENILNLITIDEMVVDTLRRQDLTLADIPAAGQTVNVRQTGNISSGGTSIDRTEEIHPDNALVARIAAKTMGLKMAGVDIIMPDISRSVWETGGGIAEVNSGPGFRLHNRPFSGKPRNVVGAVIDMYYPAGTPVRVPVVAVASGDESEEIASRIAGFLTIGGQSVGLAIPDRAVINGVAAHPTAADVSTGSMVLRNAGTELAVIHVSTDDLAYPGLPFDRVDVAVLVPGGTPSGDAPQIENTLIQILEGSGRLIVSENDVRAESLMRQHGNATILVGSESDIVHRHIAAGGVAVTSSATHVGAELCLHEAGSKHKLGMLKAGDDTWLHTVCAAVATGLGVDRRNIADTLSRME